jgi:ribosomal protein S27AE
MSNLVLAGSVEAICPHCGHKFQFILEHFKDSLACSRCSSILDEMRFEEGGEMLAIIEIFDRLERAASRPPQNDPA